MLWIEYPTSRDDRPIRRILFMSRGAWKGGYEVNIIGHRWNLRIARHQVCLWDTYRLLAGWYAGEGIGGFWQPWNRRGSVPTTPA